MASPIWDLCKAIDLFQQCAAALRNLADSPHPTDDDAKAAIRAILDVDSFIQSHGSFEKGSENIVASPFEPPVIQALGLTWSSFVRVWQACLQQGCVWAPRNVRQEIELLSDFESAITNLRALLEAPSRKESLSTNAVVDEGTGTKPKLEMALKEEFPHGPLTGTKKLLAAAICPEFDRKPYARILDQLAKAGFIRLLGGGKNWSVFFRDQRTYAECNARIKTLLSAKSAH